jgi:hypothetical protein
LIIKLFEVCFHTYEQLYFIFSDLKIIGHGNPDNNLESPRKTPTYQEKHQIVLTFLILNGEGFVVEHTNDGKFHNLEETGP